MRCLLVLLSVFLTARGGGNAGLEHRRAKEHSHSAFYQKLCSCTQLCAAGSQPTGQAAGPGAYHPNKQLVLSITKADCEGNAYDYPCYTARRDGHADNSDYVSIEYSTGYEGFSPGYYIVVAAIGAPGSSVVSAVLASARKWYPNAYAKQTPDMARVHALRHRPGPATGR